MKQYYDHACDPNIFSWPCEYRDQYGCINCENNVYTDDFTDDNEMELGECYE